MWEERLAGEALSVAECDERRSGVFVAITKGKWRAGERVEQVLNERYSRPRAGPAARAGPDGG